MLRATVESMGFGRYHVYYGRYWADLVYLEDYKHTGRRGWYAHYYRMDPDDPEVYLTDSMKVGHPDMPTRCDAKQKALRIVKAYLRGEV